MRFYILGGRMYQDNFSLLYNEERKPLVKSVFRNQGLHLQQVNFLVNMQIAIYAEKLSLDITLAAGKTFFSR